MLRHGPFFLPFQRDTDLVNITSASGLAIFAETSNPLRRNGFSDVSFSAAMDKKKQDILI